MPPSVTIIIPSLNQAGVLRRCLRSIAALKYERKEVLVIDGGSTDDTAAVVASAGSVVTSFVCEPDAGIFDAMNKGIARARGDFLYFMGCDDELFYPMVLADVFGDPVACRQDIVYGNVMIRDMQVVYDGRFDLEKLMLRGICHQAMFTRRSLFSRMGMFDLRFRAFADWDFSVRCFADTRTRIRYEPCIVALYNKFGFSCAHPDNDDLRDEIVRKAKEGLHARERSLRHMTTAYSGALNPFHYMRLIRNRWRTVRGVPKGGW